jgi:hypothetical protein
MYRIILPYFRLCPTLRVNAKETGLSLQGRPFYQLEKAKGDRGLSDREGVQEARHLRG